VAKEPGLYPTTHLTASLSADGARPGDPLVLTIEGADVTSLTRGKLVYIEVQRDGEWLPVGTVIVRTAPGPSTWKPAGSPPFRITMEGYTGPTPMHFEVPPIPPGDYRVRIDATAGDADVEEDLRHRTATLYATLCVLPSLED
jgi:hypothetical protein